MVDSTSVAAEPESLSAALDALEGFPELRTKLAGQEAWLVGGAVRDLLLGATRADFDLVVEGDAGEVAAKLGAESRTHERFGTASAFLEDGRRVDVAAARQETYPAPGALPEVEPADLEADLARRDFTVNAMAIPLHGEPELIDPHGGRADLDGGVLRVLHPRSFADDPTRALRAARYAARLRMTLEGETAGLLRATDLATVSADRVEAELRRLLAEDRAPEAADLLHRWGLAGIDGDAAERVRAARGLLADPDWSAIADPTEALLEALRPSEAAQRAVAQLGGEPPGRPSVAVESVRGHSAPSLLIARAAGVEWLDEWVRDWRKVSLEIDGEDLLEAGVPEGPGIGRGLSAALASKLDGEIAGRDEELRVALSAAAVT